MVSAVPPSIYFESIDFNLSFYTEGESSVSLNYVNSNFLRCTGYSYSRSITTTFNGIFYCLNGINTTDITATGTITANLFSGSGAELTNLNASNISNGTLTIARGGTDVSTLAPGQFLIGNGPDPITQSSNLIWDTQNNNLGIGKNPASKLDVNGTVSATLFSGSGTSLTGLTEGQIPVLTAAKIPDLDAAKITTGTINNTILPTNYDTQLGIGTSPAVNTNLHIYNEDNSTIRLETGANGTAGVEFQRGTINDSNVDFKIVNDTANLKFLSQDEVNTYSASVSEIMRMTRTQISIYKDTQINGNVGIGTDVPATQLHIYKTTNPSIRIQSLAEGTPSIELMRGVLNDVNKDYRFVSEIDIFKLQYQDSSTSYGNNINQLIWVNTTDSIIHKPTEFKANVVISGDTRTIGYVGIGTTSTTDLHVYTTTVNILRLQTAAVNGTNSIEFMCGNSTDTLTDYRLFTDTAGKFKIQYANNLLAYGQTDTDLIDLSTTNTIIYKPTEMKGNVGIGTTPHVTYKIDCVGTINTTVFRGSTAEITDIPADKITTGTLNNDRLTLTGTKLMEACDANTFIVNPSDKLDLIPVYTFNIMAYDRLANTTTSYLEAGKFSYTYEDRNGTYALLPSYIPNLNNKVILNYRVGDKITFKNTTVTTFDYTEVPQQRWVRLSVFKMTSNISWTSQGQEISFMTPELIGIATDLMCWIGLGLA